jgi:hypothetical protein
MKRFETIASRCWTGSASSSSESPIFPNSPNQRLEVSWPVFELTDGVKIALPATSTYLQYRLALNVEGYHLKCGIKKAGPFLALPSLLFPQCHLKMPASLHRFLEVLRRGNP